jgi:hypothetical protein
MATKAERFRYEAERSGTSQRKNKKGGVSTPGSPAHARKASFAYEETPASTPASRRSTRKSKNRQKAAAALKGKQLLVLISPHHRHDSGARPNGSR